MNKVQRNDQKDNLYIKEIILQNKPFFIGRIAGCELKVAYYFQQGNIFDIVDELRELENNAGIYTKDNESLKKYTIKLIESYEHCTIIAEWEQNGKVFAHTGSAQEFIRKQTLNIPKIDARALEPYYFKDNWMSALKGKNILIIHPFSKTFSNKITNIKNIFPNQSWFEDCKIQFIEPPITLAGNHENKDWQEHLEIFLKQLKTEIYFEIALVAAGGYGMLISDYIFNEMNKSVMYIGGALQLFFGVIGRRWFDNKEILKLVNDDWSRPDMIEKPNNFINVEKGCYW